MDKDSTYLSVEPNLTVVLLQSHSLSLLSPVGVPPQVSNGHILVVIHISTASQTIKVSINDTPAQVEKVYYLLFPL